MSAQLVEPIYGETPAAWSLTTFGDLEASGAASIQTGPFGTMLHAESYVASGTPVVAVQHIGENYIRHQDLPQIGPEDRARLARYVLKEGDLLFGRKGAVERRAYVSNNEDGWLQGSDCIRVRLDRSQIDPKFVSYALGSSAYRNWITRNAQGATMPSLNQEIVRRIPIPVAPMAEQRAIARILGALDDKIELNRRMNETLEAMARALFQSWFVDFDPVRSKAEGRQPVGMDAETTALFPDALEASAFGLVPTGWEVTSLDTLATFTKGVSYASEHLRHSHAALMTLKSIRRGGGYQPQGLKPYVGPWKPDQVLRAGELVVAHTDLTQAGDVLGKVARIPRPTTYATLIASLDLTIVRPRDKTVSPEYLHGLLSGQSFSDHAASYANGTTVLHLSAKALPMFRLACPPREIVDAFTSRVAAVRELQDANDAASRTLAAIRDALLPKLLSGKVRVRETEMIVEAAV